MLGWAAAPDSAKLPLMSTSGAAPSLSSPPVRHGYVDTDRASDAGPLRLHHLVFTAADAAGLASPREPVVLVHGVTGHAAAWSGVAPLLLGSCEPIAVDLRGHGASQWSPAHDYATTTHARDLLVVIDALERPAVTMVGSSWGALVSLAFAAANPSRVKRLVLVDIEPSFTQSETDVAPRPHSFATSADVLAFERARNPNAPDEVLATVAAASVRPGASGLEPYFDPWFYERWPFRNDDWWPTLREVTAPTLVVHAGQSFVRGEVTAQMAELLPNGRHTEIASSTHVVPVDAPGELARTILDFIAATP